MPDTITLAVTVRCGQCGTVPYATLEEAFKAVERHCTITGHPVVLEAVRTG